MTRIGGKQIVRKGKGMSAFSPIKYGRLLADTLPRVITNQKEYDRLESAANSLLTKGEDNLSPEEDQLLRLLANLLEEYETRTLPPLKDVAPKDVLRFLMEQNDLKQADLEDIFGSQPNVSRALNGTRRIAADQAKGLAKRFSVSAELFI